MYKIKIVINTNPYYNLPLTKLMESIVSSELVDYSNIIIVYNESPKNTEPELINLSDLVNVNINNKVVVVKSVLKNYDYTGFNILHLFKEHELIKSDYYLYLLDTTTVKPDFYTKLNLLLSFYKNSSLISPKGPNANVLLFNKKFIEYYGDSFNRDLSKIQAVLIECNREVIIDGNIIKNPSNYPDITEIPERLNNGCLDIYGTGVKRNRYIYPTFGVYKYVLLHKDGDIKGELTDIIWPKDIK